MVYVRQQCIGRPIFSLVAVDRLRHRGGIRVVVRAAAHLEQLSNRKVAAVGHAGNVFGYRSLEIETCLPVRAAKRLRRSSSSMSP